jgi:hypothetical protein
MQTTSLLCVTEVFSFPQPPPQLPVVPSSQQLLNMPLCFPLQRPFICPVYLCFLLHLQCQPLHYDHAPTQRALWSSRLQVFSLHHSQILLECQVSGLRNLMPRVQKTSTVLFHFGTPCFGSSSFFFHHKPPKWIPNGVNLYPPCIPSQINGPRFSFGIDDPQCFEI